MRWTPNKAGIMVIQSSGEGITISTYRNNVVAWDPDICFPLDDHEATTVGCGLLVEIRQNRRGSILFLWGQSDPLQNGLPCD